MIRTNYSIFVCNHLFKFFCEEKSLGNVRASLIFEATHGKDLDFRGAQFGEKNMIQVKAVGVVFSPSCLFSPLWWHLGLKPLTNQRRNNNQNGTSSSVIGW